MKVDKDCKYIYRLSLKCRLQHGGWQWQSLITQVLAGKSKAISSLHGSLQLSKITKESNHIPYNIRCWKCCPPSSTHFWLLFSNSAFTWINSISKIQSISRLVIAFNFFNVWGFVAYTLFFKCPHTKKSQTSTH